ncbi:MAG: thymidylate synthase [Massilia sp.]
MSIRIQHPTVDDLLGHALTYLLKHGQPGTATKGAFRELIGPTLVLTNPLARLSRSESRGKLFSALGELIWYLTGEAKLDFIEWYVPGDAYRKDSTNGTVRSGYGDRMFHWRGANQVENVIDLLKSRPSSRQAVIQIFDADDLESGQHGVPCTCNLQFLLRNDRLHLFTTMRSNDAYVGFPHDVFAFTMLQEIVARSVGVEVGTYIHSVGSFHLYDDDEVEARGYIGEGFQNIVPMQPMPEGDPWPAIRKVLEFERRVRSNPTEPIPKVSDYWQNIFRLLAVHSAAKPGVANALTIVEQLGKKMSRPEYQMFVDFRISKLKEKDVQAQGSCAE